MNKDAIIGKTFGTLEVIGVPVEKDLLKNSTFEVKCRKCGAVYQLKYNTLFSASPEYCRKCKPSQRIDWSNPVNKEILLSDLSLEDKMKRFGTSKQAIKAAMKYVSKKEADTSATNDEPVVEETTVTNFEKELKFCNEEMGDFIAEYIKTNLPKSIIESYTKRLAELMHENKTLADPKLYVNSKEMIGNLLSKVMKGDIEVPVVVDTQETVNPEDNIDSFDNLSDMLDGFIDKHETKYLMAPPPSQPHVRLSVEGNLWDENAVPNIAYDRVKSLYKKNKEYFNALIALREESKDNPIKVSSSGLAFYDYCQDENRHHEKVYLIREGKNGEMYLFMKRTDFIDLLQNYLSKYRLLVEPKKYIEKLKLHHVVGDNNSHPETNTIVINYGVLKSSITIKNGILNTIIKMVMY